MNSAGEVRQPMVWRRLDMPNGDVVTIAARYADGELMDNYDDNHNIYRLNSKGEVLWQVRREDGGRWQRTFELDQLEGREKTYEPFTDFTLIYPDGTTNVDPLTQVRPDEAVWQPGCKVRLHSFDGWSHELDVDTGIATDTTSLPHRRW